jgi:hypothetical protein
LANTGITINGTTIALGASGTIVAGTDWQSVVTADGSTATTASAGEGYFIDTTSNAHTINLPSSPSQGDEVHIVDYAGTFGSNNVTVGRNGSNIDNSADDATLSTNRLNVRFVYIDATQGWRAIFDDASENYGTAHISATGGTVTTSGDYKIHTFTGDGCFVVSSIGIGIPCAQASTVDYMVVAGGGGAGVDHYPAPRGGGGGGAGGFRESKDSTLNSPHTASPLAATTGLTITATTYPVTVGGGGASGPTPAPCNATAGASQGSNSVFSTITSAGGGGGNGHGPSSNSPFPTTSGGSGGGFQGEGNPTPTFPDPNAGRGNTPPTSPPQGNNAGDAAGAPNYNYGGGGGAGARGADSPPTGNGGAGGAGVLTSISGSPISYAGGGGSSPAGGASPCGTGGAAGGANPGTANRGGGGGGNRLAAAGSGGKGIVIIRYKFQ